MEDGNRQLSVTVKQYWSFFDLISHPGLDPGSSYSFLEEQRHRSIISKMDSRFHGNDRFRTSRNDSTLKYDDAAKKEIRNALLDSIRAHMVSDVEVGAFLSGGIDSTAIVSLMRQAGHEKIKTISVTFPGNKLDESKYSNHRCKEIRNKSL